MTEPTDFDRLPSLEERVAELSAYTHALHSIDFGLSDYGDEPAAALEVVGVASANAFSSKIIPSANLHTVALDLDVPARLVPSTTPGHSHLYIDVPIEWSKYLDLLVALAAVGIVERGFVEAARQRGFTTLRLPWIKKEKEVTTDDVTPF